MLNICLMFILGLFDFARVTMARQLIVNAAREGCRLAVVSTSTLATSDIQNCVMTYLAGQQFSNLVISVYQCDPTTGNNLGSWNNAPISGSIAVQVSANYATMTPTFSLLPSSLPMAAKVVMTSEAN